MPNDTLTEDNTLLLIAYTFPPISYAGSYRTLRLCKRLGESGVRIHVLTIKIQSDILNDYTLLQSIPKSVTIHRTSTIDPWRRYQAWKRKHERIKGIGYINKFFSLFLRLMSIPDHMNFWVFFATARGLRLIKDHAIQTVYVSSPPNSSQLIGYLLKKLKRLRWFADFRDPIVGNVAEVNLIRPSDILSKIEKTIRIQFEKLIVNNADEVIANTEMHRKELLNRFKAKKFRTIRNSFDQDDYKGIDGIKYKKFTISHLGSIYGFRRADILFKAIKILEKELHPGPLRLQVLFVGLNHPGLREDVVAHGVEKYVRIKPMIPHSEAVKTMMKSHLLLLVKATEEGAYGQIPGKFFEYLGTRNRILCLGPKRSEVSEIICRLKAGAVVENDEIEMYNTLKMEYHNYLRGLYYPISSSKLGEFSSRNMSHKVMSLLNTL